MDKRAMEKKIIKECLEEFDRVIVEKQKKKRDHSKQSSSKLKQVARFIF